MWLNGPKGQFLCSAKGLQGKRMWYPGLLLVLFFPAMYLFVCVVGGSRPSGQFVCHMALLSVYAFQFLCETMQVIYVF